MHGYTDDKDRYINRLRRIEGQVRGLQRMVAEGGDSAATKVREASEAIARLVQS